GDRRVQLVERAHAIARIVATARIRPDRVPLLEARTERDDLRLALGTARRVKRDLGGKTYFVKHENLFSLIAMATLEAATQRARVSERSDSIRLARRMGGRVGPG